MNTLKEKDKSKIKNKDQTAEEIAEIMAANMRANMQNPDFLKDKDEMLQKVAHEVIKKRKERKESEDLC